MSGFTLIELLLGLSIMAVVMAALAGVLMAVASGWRQNDPARASQVQAVQSMSRVQSLLRPAKLLGALVPGALDTNGSEAASVLFWARDANGDEQIQLSELMLIEHDRSARTLRVYQMHFPAGMTDSDKAEADLTISYASIKDATGPAVFKTMNYVSGRPLMRNVTGARFVLIQGTMHQRPTVEIAMRFDRGGEQAAAYGTAVLAATAVEPTS